MLYKFLVFLTLSTQWDKLVIAQFSQCDGQSSFKDILPKGCGTLGSVKYVAGGRQASRQDLPWQAAVYSKKTTPYMQICGGTVVSTSVVLSAAHCFWSDLEQLLPAEDYAVAVSKLYRPWNDPEDKEFAQKSDIREIRVPPRYQGSTANFQDDLALLLLTQPFQIGTKLIPVCLDFGYDLDTRQLTHGNFGKVAGWGRTDANAASSPTLQVADLPAVDISECIAKIDRAFLPAITSDKICAGYTDRGVAVCMGDSGGGLSFYDNSTRRFYLRGVVSTAPKSEDLCNIYTYATFTHIIKHGQFILSVLSEAAQQTAYQFLSSRTSDPQHGSTTIHQTLPTTSQNTTNADVPLAYDERGQFNKPHIVRLQEPIEPYDAIEREFNIQNDTEERQLNILHQPIVPYNEKEIDLNIPHQSTVSYDAKESELGIPYDTEERQLNKPHQPTVSYNANERELNIIQQPIVPYDAKETELGIPHHPIVPYDTEERHQPKIHQHFYQHPGFSGIQHRLSLSRETDTPVPISSFHYHSWEQGSFTT